jgi:preprotein translocase subunit SecG
MNASLLMMMNYMMMFAEGDEAVSPAYPIVRLVLLILVMLCSISLIWLVLLQSGNSQGLGASFGGGAETFLSKNKAKTTESRRKRWTVWVSILLAIFLIALAIIKIIPF